jgi:hypothetical protein
MFDSDPIGREKSGVRRYRIYRKAEDPNYIIVDLEFDNSNDAQAALVALRNLWGKVEGTIMANPQARILDMVELREY